MPVNFFVCHATPAMKDLANGTWNHRFVEFKPSDRATRNEHEFSAQVRRNTEITLASNLANLVAKKQRDGKYRVFIFDVGGNPTRTGGTFNAALRARDREVRYHAITPLMTETDYQRQLDPDRRGHCQHTFEECVHRGCLAKLIGERAANQNGPWDKTTVVFNFTDSAYYIDPQVMLHALASLDAIAVGCNHTFPQVPGVYAVPHDTVNEGAATVTPDGMVSMLVAGNKHSYYHPNFVLPQAALPGTLFNANYSLSGFETGTFHAMMDNTQYALSFEQQIRCGSYIGWRAISVPIASTTSIPPGIRDMRVSNYTAECLACRVVKREEVTVVVAKMMRRAKLPTDTLAVVVQQTLDQLASLERPLETPGSVKRNWWYYAGKLAQFVGKIHNAIVDIDDRNDDSPEDRARATDAHWLGGDIVGDEDPDEDEGQGGLDPPPKDEGTDSSASSDSADGAPDQAEGGGLDLDVPEAYKNDQGEGGSQVAVAASPQVSPADETAAVVPAQGEPAKTGSQAVDESADGAPAAMREEGSSVLSESAAGNEHEAVASHTPPTGEAPPERACQEQANTPNIPDQRASVNEPARANEQKPPGAATQQRWVVKKATKPHDSSDKSSKPAKAKANPGFATHTQATSDSSASSASVNSQAGSRPEEPKAKPPDPPRRTKALTKKERLESGMTVEKRGCERAVPPEFITSPTGERLPPLPGPGITPPVASEPRTKQPQGPEPDIQYEKLWVKDG